MANSWRPWEAAGTQPLSTGDVNKAINLPPPIPPTTSERPTNVTLPSISALLGEPLRDENTANYAYEKHRAGPIHPPPRPFIPPTIHHPAPAVSAPFPRHAAPIPLAHPSAPQSRPVPHQHAPIAPSQAQAPVPPPAPAKSTTRKRKSDVLEDPESGERDRPSAELPNCDQLRDKITSCCRNIPLQEFSATINCPPEDINHFMSLHGPQAGSESQVFRKAAEFFKSREPARLPTPPKPQPVQRIGPRQPNKRPARLAPALDVGDVTLDGEEDQSVKVFDTCDRVRRKINKFLTDHDDVTASAFCREIAKALPNDRKVQSKQLNDFLAKKGPTAGNTSCVYYTAYVFFEKRRIKDGKNKDQARLKMEEIHPDGMNTTELLTHVTVFRGEEPVMDEYGRVHYITAGGGGGGKPSLFPSLGHRK